jgi:hypothetical protein
MSWNGLENGLGFAARTVGRAQWAEVRGAANL